MGGGRSILFFHLGIGFGNDVVEEREKKERVMCLIGHVSNFDWGNGRYGGKEMEVNFSLYIYIIIT